MISLRTFVVPFLVALATGWSPVPPAGDHNGQPPSYDVAADGRFLMIKPTGETDAPISVILNWSEAPGASR